VTTWGAPYFLEQNESADQLAGSEGIGWQPTVDVDFQHDPGPTPGRGACTSIMQKAGQGFSDPGVANAAYAYCESLFFLRAALATASQPTAASLQQGAASLGIGFASVLTFGERFGPGRFAPVSAVRPIRFDSACSCYRYSGAMLSFG
jgi:multidrug transporter EmrE-like cation transporter